MTELNKTQLKELEKVIGGKDLMLFFVEWCNNGQNATAAYETLHENVTHESAMVLGHRMLRRVNLEDVMSVMGMNTFQYLTQIKEGTQATKPISARVILKKGSTELSNQDAWSKTDDFVEVPDYAVRKQYLDEEGSLLGLRKSKDEGGGAAFVIEIHPALLIKDESKIIEGEKI